MPHKQFVKRQGIVYLTDIEKLEVISEATKTHLSFSEWVRQAAIEKLERLKSRSDLIVNSSPTSNGHNGVSPMFGLEENN